MGGKLGRKGERDRKEENSIILNLSEEENEGEGGKGAEFSGEKVRYHQYISITRFSPLRKEKRREIAKKRQPT